VWSSDDERRLRVFAGASRDIEALGVRRISVGGALALAAWTGLVRAAQTMKLDGSFAGLANLARRFRAPLSTLCPRFLRGGELNVAISERRRAIALKLRSRRPPHWLTIATAKWNLL